MDTMDIDVRKHDQVRGWFGVATVTDVAFGYIDIEGEDLGPVDNMVRIEQTDRKGRVRTTFIYRQDIEQNLTAEASLFRG